ncbi:hypothetical protein [Mycolicibacterium sp. PDY-3]|uniref:hypothetical protein n=1 Tax=Mycolicibacterium sp. PDY-3 TaxID=3376069 RepID=UPI00379E0604
MNYGIEAQRVIEDYYGPDPQVTYEPAVEVATESEIAELKAANRIGTALRTIHVLLSSHDTHDPNGWLHRYDLWPTNKNLVRSHTLTTTSTLPLDQYARLLAAAFSEKHQKIHAIEEGGS